MTEHATADTFVPTSQQASAWDIRLAHATLGYGTRVVLEDVDVTLPAGKITLILGESGCGKSTLLRHVIGLNRPMSGQIVYGGRDVFALPTAQFRRIRRRFGVLFQDGALLGALTLVENVALPLAEHTRLPRALVREAALRALTLVGLADFAEYYPSQLSGGMKKRGGLARAIVTEPPVLFCDEPTSGLDPINAAQMDALLLDMKVQYPAMTIIVVSHDLASVARIAEHVVVLRAGKVVFSDSHAAFTATKDPYLQRFMGREPAAGTRRADAPSPNAAVRDAIEAWLDA